MTAWRSSRLLAETRSSSPVIWALMFFGPCSRMIFEIFFAFSWSRPSFRPASIRYSLPDRCGSPASTALSETPRLMSLVWKTSRTALTRSSLFARMTIVSPLHAIDASTFLKSYRCEISLAAWLSALSTSCRSTLLTTSKDDSLATVHPSGVPVPDGTSARPPAGACYPCTRCRRSRRRGGLPEWPKGAVCKTVGIAYAGSNPSPATSSRTAAEQQRSWSAAVVRRADSPAPARASSRAQSAGATLAAGTADGQRGDRRGAADGDADLGQRRTAAGCHL